MSDREQQSTRLKRLKNSLENRWGIIATVAVVFCVSMTADFIKDVSVIRNLFSSKSDSSHVSKTELVNLLNFRATGIADNFDRMISEIDKAAHQFQTKECEPRIFDEPIKPSDQADLCHRIAKETFERTKNIRQLKEKFMTLHEDHVTAHKNGEEVLARDVDKKIQLLLTSEFKDIGYSNVGINPGVYLHGYETVIVDVRHITDVRGANLYEFYWSAPADKKK